MCFLIIKKKVKTFVLEERILFDLYLQNCMHAFVVYIIINYNLKYQPSHLFK